MPQAISCYLETNNLSEVDNVKKHIFLQKDIKHNDKISFSPLLLKAFNS